MFDSRHDCRISLFHLLPGYVPTKLIMDQVYFRAGLNISVLVQVAEQVRIKLWISDAFQSTFYVSNYYIKCILFVYVIFGI